MTITEALKLVQKVPPDAISYDVLLACGFTPLHLQTLLRAHVQKRIGDRKANLTTGLYGDLPGTIQSAADRPLQAMAVVIEWSDLDPRLGFREGGRWGLTAIEDILRTVDANLCRIAAALRSVPAGTRTVVALPGLPFPVLFHTPGWQADSAELRIQELVSSFATDIAAQKGIVLLNPQWLAENSPPAGRYDFKSDILTGLPYTLAHADALAAGIAMLLAPAAAKKGIITDLDDTLWYGIVGEVGPENVTWDLASHRYLHGLYQRLLATLAEEGVLVGIASRNDPAVAREALNRPDCYLPTGKIYPVEIHWNTKSSSVSRILRTWNVAADAVVFVDDSQMELAEVAGEHPGIECVLFPKDDYAAGYRMLRTLRDKFGKERVSEDNAIRLESIRRGAEFQEAASDGAASEEFLSGADARVSIDFQTPPDDARVLELVNKTNQFNLNGIRYTDADWRRLNNESGAFTMAVSYEDRFGPLGKIAVIQGRTSGRILTLNTWVMSCRAFARRIEHQCVRALFDKFEADSMVLQFTPTPRNGPIRDFLQSVIGTIPGEPSAVTREQFQAACPPLYHQVVEIKRSQTNG